MKLHLVALRRGPCLMGSHRVDLPLTRFIPAMAELHLDIYIHKLQQQSPTVNTFHRPTKDDSLCHACYECHRDLNPGRWRKRRVCYHTACSLHVYTVYVLVNIIETNHNNSTELTFNVVDNSLSYLCSTFVKFNCAEWLRAASQPATVTSMIYHLWPWPMIIIK